MRKLLIIVACSLFAYSGWAQTVLIVTNAAYTPAPDPANPDHYLYANDGTVRLNDYVTDGIGGDPLNMNDIQNSGSFQLEVFDILDGYRVQNLANTTTPELSSDGSHVRFNLGSLNARTYEVKATAVPSSGTNDAYVILWSYLTVTSAPTASAGSYSLSLINIAAQTVTATRVIADNLDVSGAINAVDTGAVKLVGSIMTGPLTGTVISATDFIGSGDGLTDLVASNSAVTFTPANYTGTGNVEGDLQAIDAELAASGGGDEQPGWASSNRLNGAGLLYHTGTPDRVFQVNTNRSVQLATNGNARGAYSVDLQGVDQAAEVASGSYNLVGGRGNTIGGNNNLVGGASNSTTSGTGNIIGGHQNAHNGSYGISVGSANAIPNNYSGAFGANHTVSSAEQYEYLFGGSGNTIGGNNPFSGATGWNTILGGEGNWIDRSRPGYIISGVDNSNSVARHSGTVGGTLNNMLSTWASTIVGGTGNTINNSTNVSIIGGANSAMDRITNAVILASNVTMTNGFSNLIALSPNCYWNMTGTNTTLLGQVAMIAYDPQLNAFVKATNGAVAWTPF